MQHKTLLVFSMVLMAVAMGCTKENTSGDSAGIKYEVGENTSLFILNQGNFPATSTLDVLDLSTGKYYADIFGYANPAVVQGLGNTGNDMALIGDQLWVLMNASNQIAIINPKTGELIRFLQVDCPRYIIHEGEYAYVTSYGAAVVNYDGYASTPATNVRGRVYRIHTSSFVTTILEVGYQPEGLAILDGKLYVANSGGFQAEPDNTISVIDLGSYSLSKTLTMPVRNLNRLFAAGGKLWLSTYDIWEYNTVSKQYEIAVSASLGSVNSNGTYTLVPNVHPAVIACQGNSLISGDYSQIWKVSVGDGSATPLTLQGDAFPGFTNYYPYGLAIHPENGNFFVADASFTGDSKVYAFNAFGNCLWNLTSGIGTGPMLVL